MDFKTSANVTEKGKRQKSGSNKNTVVSCQVIFPLGSKEMVFKCTRLS